jgi:hypothetical protein
MAYSPIYTSATNIYGRTGLTSSEVDLSVYDYIIEDAELEVEYLTGRKWTNGTTKTEFFNGPKKDILGVSGQKATTINLTEYPIQSITEFKTLNTDGTASTTFATLTSVQVAAGTFDTTDYWIDTIEDPITHTLIPYGKITLKAQEFPVGIKNIKVSYTYGYSSVPVAIRNLATCLAGIRAWIRFLGGSYNYLNSYSIPQQSVNKGDFYDRGLKMIEELTKESDRILDRVGRRPRTLFYGSGADR